MTFVEYNFLSVFGGNPPASGSPADVLKKSLPHLTQFYPTFIPSFRNREYDSFLNFSTEHVRNSHKPWIDLKKCNIFLYYFDRFS